MEYIRELLIARAAALLSASVELDNGVIVSGTVAFVSDSAVYIDGQVIAISKIVRVI